MGMMAVPYPKDWLLHIKRKRPALSPLRKGFQRLHARVAHHRRSTFLPPSRKGARLERLLESQRAERKWWSGLLKGKCLKMRPPLKLSFSLKVYGKPSSKLGG